MFLRGRYCHELGWNYYWAKLIFNQKLVWPYRLGSGPLIEWETTYINVLHFHCKTYE